MSDLKDNKTAEIDLGKLSVQQLQNMSKNIDEELKNKERQVVISCYEEMQNQAKELGFENLEALHAKYVEYKAESKKTKSRAPVEPIFQNKENPKETWTGRGKPPRWLNNIAKERNVEVSEILEEFRI